MPAKSKNEESADTAKQFDVAKPGKTPATVTSRPIIVGHGSTTKQDPMVTTPPEGEKTLDSPTLQTHGNAVVNPVESPANEEIPQEDNSPKSSESENSSDPSSTDFETSDSAAVDALANEANTKKEHQKEGDAEAAHVMELEKIIESKRYFVPVGQAQRRRSNRRILIVIILLLIITVASANFAIDAEVLELGIEPLTDIL